MVDRIEGSKQLETSELYSWRFERQSITKEDVNLPSQRQPPSPDSVLGVIIPLGAESDVLSRLVIREDPLYPFVELLGKCRQVPGGVEPGTPELLWLRLEQSTRECKWGVRAHLGPSPSP